MLEKVAHRKNRQCFNTFSGVLVLMKHAIILGFIALILGNVIAYEIQTTIAPQLDMVSNIVLMMSLVGILFIVIGLYATVVRVRKTK